MNDRAATVAETPVEPMPPLEAGDHLDQKTFHERYKAMPRGSARRIDRGSGLHAVAVEGPTRAEPF